MIVAADVGQLAAAVFAEAERHPSQSAERRAASHLWVALTVPPARSIASARNAVATFGDERTQADALELLSKITNGGRP